MPPDAWTTRSVISRVRRHVFALREKRAASTRLRAFHPLHPERIHHRAIDPAGHGEPVIILISANGVSRLRAHHAVWSPGIVTLTIERALDVSHQTGRDTRWGCGVGGVAIVTWRTVVVAGIDRDPQSVAPVIPVIIPRVIVAPVPIAGDDLGRIDIGRITRDAGALVEGLIHRAVPGTSLPVARGDGWRILMEARAPTIRRLVSARRPGGDRVARRGWRLVGDRRPVCAAWCAVGDRRAVCGRGAVRDRRTMLSLRPVLRHWRGVRMRHRMGGRCVALRRVLAVGRRGRAAPREDRD